MPVWHEATKALQDAGKVRMVGIIQEQHPDRCRLFMQWKQMDWPIMVDSQNGLGVPVVPITMFIDGQGVILKVRPRARNAEEITRLVEEFIGVPVEPALPEPPTAAPDLNALTAATGDGSADAFRELGAALLDFGGPDKLDEAVLAHKRSVAAQPDNGPAHFQLGVAYRKRFDSSHRQSGDFQKAVDHWSKALAINPNQYIWRRRIEQYGPRLHKPYSFYDWVHAAREEIAARGEEPVTLIVEPSGAEFARPVRSFSAEDEPREEPDAEGRIHRDDRSFITVETSVVPAAVRPGGVVRVHILFTPNPKTGGHWNNEAQPMELWIDPPASCAVDHRSLRHPNAAEAVSGEIRALEFEVQIAEDASPGELIIPAYALYNVCEGEDATCLYRRQDVRIRIPVVGK